MNRRAFIKGMAGALLGFSVLPDAKTYHRTWKKAEVLWLPNPPFRYHSVRSLGFFYYLLEQRIKLLPPELREVARKNPALVMSAF